MTCPRGNRWVALGLEARAPWAGVDSDYDLMVVMQGDGDERQTSWSIYRAVFRERIPAPVDIVDDDAASLQRRRTKCDEGHCRS